MRSTQTAGKKLELSKKNWIQLVAMTVIFVIAAFLVYKTTITTRMVMPRVETAIKAEEGKYLKLESGDLLEQSFCYHSDELLCAGTKISLEESVLKDLVANQERRDLGVIHINILDAEDQGTSLMTGDYDVYLLEDGQNLLASFLERQTGWEGKNLILTLRAEDLNPDIGLKVGITEKGEKEASLCVNAEPVSENINIVAAGHQFLYWKQWFVFGTALVYFCLTGTYFLLAVFEKKPQQVFLFTGTVLAFLYLLLLPPLTVPDEEVHFKEAYYHVNRILGKQQTEGAVLMDLEDFHGMQEFETTPSLCEYDRLKDSFFEKGRETGTIEVERFDTQAPVVTYLPGMAGIMLGRALGLNGVNVIVLGRFFSILFYLFTMYWVIRLMPMGKAAAFILAILPMTIQQCCSYSYDSVVIESAFLYLAVLFGLIYKDEPIRRWQVVLYVLFMVILSICKGGTYMPLCLLTMLIPISRFRDKKQKWIFVGVMAFVAIAAFLSSTLGYVLYVAAPTEEQAANSYLAGEAYGAAGLLREPLIFIYLSVRTLFLSGDGFLETMLGMQLGWLNIFVSRIVIYGLLLLMVLSVLTCENQEDMKVTFWQKIFYALVAFMPLGMVLVSMFMSWTPKNSTEIAGIQGRYLLPALPVLLLLFRSGNVTVKKDRSRAYMFLALCLQCGAIYGILLSLERVL
ncbi:MAG: DUF2142 domain-containing protein [Roseburia sp.]|nr:DUF2142 domain-containing protein [Roseburia sp.]